MKTNKKGYLGERGYYVNGWIEVDEYGKPVVGRIGLKLYNKKKDILAEGLDFIGRAMLTVDLPDLSKHRPTINLSK